MEFLLAILFFLIIFSSCSTKGKQEQSLSPKESQVMDSVIDGKVKAENEIEQLLSNSNDLENDTKELEEIIYTSTDMQLFSK